MDYCVNNKKFQEEPLNNYHLEKKYNLTRKVVQIYILGRNR